MPSVSTQVFRFLNQPLVKEGVKNIASTTAFAFGLIEAYDIYQILRGREISSETDPHWPKWMQVANKIIILCAKISLILSAATSRPGVFILSTLIGQFFSSQQLEYVFGPNTIFEVNPCHPRHIFSIVAVALALPALIQSTYRGVHWIYQKLPPQKAATFWFTDSKIRLMTLLNTLGSRPVQHLGNQACRLLI